MKKTIKTKTALLLTITLFSLPCFASEHDGHKIESKKGVEALSQDLRSLLSQEMVALEKGVSSLVPKIAAGDWHAIEETAKKIKNSYILKQKLTKEQAKELHANLSESFIEMDGQFHEDAGMLANAAQNRNAELVNFYFYKMNNACTNCHSKNATHRFPSFIEEKEAVHSH